MQLEQVLQIPLTLKYCAGQDDKLQSLPFKTLEPIQLVQLAAEISQLAHGLVQIPHLLFMLFLNISSHT